MARQWVFPIDGVLIFEDGEEEYVSPIGGFAVQEDQAAAEAAATVAHYAYPMRVF